MTDNGRALKEKALKELVDANAEQNRKNWALEWKRQGGKVIGLLCSYIPEEVIYAAGMLPWRISGTWHDNLPLARIYRPVNTCPFCAHVLESFLSGELSFLDGVVGTDYDDDRRRLFDVVERVIKPPFKHMLHVPHQQTELAYHIFQRDIRQLIDSLERTFGVKITDASLWKAIETYDTMRRQLMRLYELRKQQAPPVSGHEALGLSLASTVMPKDEFNKQFADLLPYIESRSFTSATGKPRLLVSSDALDNPAYLKIVEDVGAVVAMDDLDTGSRYFWNTVDTTLSDPVYALARRYITRPACPRMFFWPQQVDQVIQWVKEYQIDGVLHFPQQFGYCRLFGVPFFKRKLAEAGIAVTTVEREYHLANVGQLQTRIQAFLETIGAEA